MNWHEKGDRLEQICRSELLRRWPGSEILETKRDSVHGIDFAVRIRGGGIAIVEVKSAYGSVRGEQMSPHWIASRLNASLEAAIVNAFRLKQSVFRASYRVHEHSEDLQVRAAKPTGELRWEELFGDRLFPDAAALKLVRADASLSGWDLTVTHQISDGAAREVHEYGLDVRQLSMPLVESTLEFRTFPFRVPHSHRVVRDGLETYRRVLADWSSHLQTKTELQSTDVETRFCVQCSALFYDSSDHRRCHRCMSALLASNVREADDLIARASRLVSSANWNVAASEIKGLQQAWKGIQPLPRNEAQRLWDRFCSACQRFFDARTHAFEAQERARQDNKRKALGLIDKARKASRSSDLKTAANEIKALQQVWKSVNPLPRDDAATLWDQFNQACQAFFDARTHAFEAQERARQDNKRKALGLIDEARRVARSSDLKAAANEIKALQQAWKSVNPLPRDDAETLWDQFNQACQTFFEMRRRAFDQAQSEWRSKTNFALEKASSASSNISDSIEHDRELIARWEQSVNNLHPGGRAEEIRADLEEKIRAVGEKIYLKREKLREIANSIADMRGKLSR